MSEKKKHDKKNNWSKSSCIQPELCLQLGTNGYSFLANKSYSWKKNKKHKPCRLHQAHQLKKKKKKKLRGRAKALSASGSCQTAAKDTAEWKQKAALTGITSCFRPSLLMGRTGRWRTCTPRSEPSLQEAHLLQVKQGDRVLHPFFPSLCLCPREGPPCDVTEGTRK